MAKVVVSLPANADFETIVWYLALQAVDLVAARYGADFRALLQRFAKFPDSGGPRPSLGANVRIGVVAPYVVIYEYDEVSATVLVLRIVHGSRRLNRKLIR